MLSYIQTRRNAIPSGDGTLPRTYLLPGFNHNFLLPRTSPSHSRSHIIGADVGLSDGMEAGLGMKLQSPLASQVYATTGVA